MEQKQKGRIVLIIGGGIAAYKSLDLTRHLMRAGFEVDCVMTKSATQFIQPLSFASLSGNKVRGQLFDEDSEAEMDHIALSRSADLLLVAPATANLIAKMAAGIADELATTLLLATDTPIMLAPAMNWRMWAHKATKRNAAQLKQDGVHILEPDVGEMACGEYGAGRLPDSALIADRAITLIDKTISLSKTSARPRGSLSGKKFLLTSGATREALDPVRYISNHSSGKQGTALAKSLIQRGAEVFFIEGISTQEAPKEQGAGAGALRHIKVETAEQMKRACEEILSQHKIDGALCVAAVCDWRINPEAQKMKKAKDGAPNFEWQENPDILAGIASSPHRPNLVIGFAAETENLLQNARAKLKTKQCDWIIANDVSKNVFGSDFNQAFIIGANKEQAFPEMTKIQLAEKILGEIESYFSAASVVKV